MDALLQLADEAADVGVDDPLLSLADTICTAQHAAVASSPPPPPAAAESLRGPALCSTRAFTAATPHNRTPPGGAVLRQPQSQQQQQQHEVQHYVEKLTGLKIKLPRVSGVVLKERYRSVACVPVSRAQQHIASEGSSWVVIGVLVSKQISTTAKGAPYSRWRVSDLAGSDTYIALFGKAHKEHCAEAEGSVLAFYNPRFSSKGPGGSTVSSSSSSNGLAVSQAAQVEQLATSAGWGFCRGVTKTGARCSSAVDTTVSRFCQYHALQQTKTLRAPVKGHPKQQQPAEVPAPPAVSNGKVFDARSKTWSNTICPAPKGSATATTGSSNQPSSTVKQPGSNGNNTGMGVGGFNSRSSSSIGQVSSIARAPGNGIACSIGKDGGVASGGSTAGGGILHSSSQQRAKTAAQQAELREALKSKLQQQQQQQKQGAQGQAGNVRASTSAAGAEAGTRQQQHGRSSGGGGFNLMTVMAAVANGAVPGGDEEEEQPRQQPHQQQQTQQTQIQARQQQQQQQSHHRQQQATLPPDKQRPSACHQPQPTLQQQQQQQQGLDELIDQLFDDGDFDDDEEEEDAEDDDDDDLIIEPAARAAGANTQQQQQQMQDGCGPAAATSSVGVDGQQGSSAAAAAAARASAASAMARLSASRPGAGSTAGGGGGSTAAKLTDARKRMKVALGLAPKQSLSSSGSGGGSSRNRKGAAGGLVAAGSGGGSKVNSAARPHVSRIGAVGAASVGAAAAAAAPPARGSSSSSSATGALLSSAGVAARSGSQPSTAPGRSAAVAAAGVGATGITVHSATKAGGSTTAGAGAAGAPAASGFRAMFGRVLQRSDVNKPDAKLLGAVSDAAHASMMGKLLDQYEQKDNLAQQLEGITKLEITAFECRTCKFLTEKRRATCASHDVVPVRVTKRWWICEACGWRLHTLRELMPSKRCPKCRDPEKLFRPTSAYTAPKPQLVNADTAGNPVASREALLPRGQEHAFCLNSLQG